MIRQIKKCPLRKKNKIQIKRLVDKARDRESGRNISEEEEEWGDC